MPNSLLDGFSLIDSTGRLILATTLATLVLGFVSNLFVRSRYAGLERDLEEHGVARRRFSNDLLNDIVRDAEKAARQSPEPNVQGIIEEHFQTDLKSLLLAERFVRTATGLVIILGLLGTFYGLTSSIGKLVHLVSGDGGGVADVTQGVTTGLTQALSGMAVAFSNSLVGIVSAVILTVLGVFSSPTDHRVALMIRIEAHLDRVLSDLAPKSDATADVEGSGARRKTDALERTVAGFGESVERLEGAVARFESALQSFSSSTRDFTEFNAHLKDNVQRMSLSFGDFSDTLKTQVVALKRGNGQ
jgi:MotA/TolQ/ExbB proton channel family